MRGRSMLAALLLAIYAVGTAAAEDGGRLARLLGENRVPNGLGVNIQQNTWDLISLRAIRAAGFRLIRTDLPWAAVERERGRYDWSAADRLLANVRQAGLTPLLILDYSNGLYAQPFPGRKRSPSLAYAPPASGEARVAFMRFVTAAAARYGQNVIWEIWNEPNLNFGQPADLATFAGFAVEACRRVRDAAHDSAIIGPAAAGFAWRLLRLVQEADTRQCFDAISVHPYRDRAPEGVLADWAALAAELCPGRGSCGRMVSSEWGYSARGGRWTEERQADYVLRSYLLNLLARVPLSIIYDWRNDGRAPGDMEANFGLLDYEGRPKPAFAALSALLSELDGLRLLGRVPLHRRGAIALAFGEGDRPLKLVGWSVTGDQDALVPAEACVLGPAAKSCSTEPVRVGADMRLRLGGRPAVAAIPQSLRVK